LIPCGSLLSRAGQVVGKSGWVTIAAYGYKAPREIASESESGIDDAHVGEIMGYDTDKAK
jgi:hypothetical protein